MTIAFVDHIVLIVTICVCLMQARHKYRLLSWARAKMPSKQIRRLQWIQKPVHSVRQTLILNLDQAFNGSLLPGKSMDFKTFIDQPRANIYFNIQTNGTIYFKTLSLWQGRYNVYTQSVLYLPNGKLFVPFNMTQLTNRSMRNVQPLEGSSPRVQFVADDPRRFSGYYIYRLFTKRSDESDTPFSLKIDTEPVDNQSRLPDQQVSKDTQATTIVTIVIFVVFGTLLFAIGLAFGRSWFRWFRGGRRRGQVGDEAGVDMEGPQRPLPVSAIYRVILDPPTGGSDQPQQLLSQPQRISPLNNQEVQPLSIHRYTQDGTSPGNLYVLQYAILLPSQFSTNQPAGLDFPRIVIGSTLAEQVSDEVDN
ncbi:hypothetical protein EC973_006884 [Apophysomyces ossiformis]|uniref:Uncharacterized protein n=1 Tax=Apophysomyces ossiformis TaxID=679940 RepID=A0A8H7BUJ7_9FUNG|nr:hypothetical protein EC973_006884 [Apophysomyces ossiformis]